jgi:prepilin-type processing-associated H-X9-DG protein
MPWNDEQYGGALWPYMETSAIHVCPIFRRYAGIFGGDHPGHNANIPIIPQYSYSQNNYLGVSYGVLKKSAVADPDRVFVFTEENPWIIPELTRWVLNDTCMFPRHSKDPTSMGDCFATYHTAPGESRNEGLANAVFVDGHVAFVDAWNSRETSWGSVSSSYYHAWPKENVFSEERPY